jgi:hypothetical protein
MPDFWWRGGERRHSETSPHAEDARAITGLT